MTDFFKSIERHIQEWRLAQGLPELPEKCPICELPDESCPHIWTTFKEIPLGEDFYDENGNWLEKRSEKMGLGWCDGNPEYLFFEPEEKVRRK